MRTIAIINLKGGVAKTTSSINIAYILMRKGYKVLLVDNDKQGDCSRGMNRRTQDGEGIDRIMVDRHPDMEKLINKTDYLHLDIITANGSGGDYSDCSSKMTVYLGDTDVSDDSIFTVTVSACVTGHWDETSRTYYVTAMSADNGYVDIDALYGTGDRYLTTRKGLRLTTRAGKYILVQSGGAHIRKRFSISKAKDGKIGLSYDLHSSTLAVRKRKDGKTLIPASITFSATQNDNGLVRSYSGRYSIQETEDGTTYTLKYVSTSDEIQKIYTPSSANIKAVRCTLLSAGGVSELDTQTVIILADAEGLTDDIKKAQGTADQAKEDLENSLQPDLATT